MIITAGKYKGYKIDSPQKEITRPTLSKVRMSIFNTLQSLTSFEGKTFLDMYAGSGIMGLEAISRGFKNAVAIEKNIKAVSVIKSNFKKVPEPPQLIIGDCLKIITKFDTKFDVIYIDPPYFAGNYEKSLEAVKDIAAKFIIIEHVTDLNFDDFNFIKQKKYGDKFITFLSV